MHATTSPTTGTDASAAVPDLPAWAVWHCATDDLFWGATDGHTCWFCGSPGTVAHAPALTSQHGADADAA